MDISGINASYTDYLAEAGDPSSTKLENKLSTDYSNSTDQELMDVCKQFESYFLEQVFKEMKKTVPESEDSSSGSGTSMLDYFQDEAMQDLAAQSTESNSLGLANMLYEQMKRNYSI